ncbi:hypothetical protein M3Y97_00084900 [Aphelenchoides bicaudatus]|nr:hypothetical protein M3Y97_00084900 [Aphelenchoides bicaudatus]
MSIVEANSAQSASSLKSRYYKYLESLCTANGIDITTLKNGAIECDTLEMFFGGLPALIGLRYFDKLRVLCLVSQDITNLNPLSEVSSSLEELWVCEGSLKDLTGLETCKQLRRLYLYDCAIEDGSPISQLTSLDVLWIQNNRLQSMEFLDSLQFLTILKAGGEQFSDSAATSIEKWPVKLQQLDLDGNCLSSLKPLLGVCSCEVVRYFDVCSGKYAPSRLIRDDRQMAWIAYSFPFLERLNVDVVTEKFTTSCTTMAETALFDELNRSIKAERDFWSKTDLAEKNSEKISEKLISFVNALAKASSVTTKKEGRRELTISLQEQCQLRLKNLKKVKAGMLEYEKSLYYFSSYLLPSLRLESAYQCQIREFNKNELQNLEEVLQKFSMKNDEPKIKLKYALTFMVSTGDLSRTEMEKWFHAESGTPIKLWNLQSVVELCDRRLSSDYCTEMRLFRNLTPLCNSAQNSEVFVLAPLLRINQNTTNGQAVNGNAEPKNAYENGENEKTVQWSNLELVAVCLIELQRIGQCQFDELHSYAVFDERFNEQIKKLKDVGIDLKLEKAVIQRDENAEDEENLEVTENTASNKGINLEKTEKLWITLMRIWKSVDGEQQIPVWNGRQMSIRNPLELTIAYSRASPSFEKTTFYKTITCLDLCDLQISKLDGIENLTNLHCLNLANNKLTTIKKLRTLKSLTFLDISGNNIAKIDDLPSLINELRVARNGLTCLGFCTKLQLLTRLNVSRNKLKSLKGIELSKLLQIVIASDNLIKMTNNELDIFANFPKLSMVDLIGNPAVENEGYRKRLLCIVPGKVLTFEFIEKTVPDFEEQKVLSLNDQFFQMIALDRNATSKLQHITELNMSNNALEHIYELVDLKTLKKLNLSNNQIVALCSTDFGTNPDVEILSELEELDLSFNNLNCQSLSRIGLEKLPSLRKLLLVGNQLARFDGAQFDFPNLNEIDLSVFLAHSVYRTFRQNEIRSVRKKTLSHLISLNLADNRLKELDGLEVPKMQILNLSNNRIGSCAALKNLKLMKELKVLNCRGNPVTERRVYHEFIKSSLKQLEELDSVTVQQRRSQSMASNNREVVSSQRTGDVENRPTATLPPLVKLANSQSSEVKRYNSLIQKAVSPSLDYLSNDNEPVESLTTKVVPMTRVVQRQTATVYAPPQIKAPRSHSIEINKLSWSRSNFPESLIIAGTRAVKHYRH